MPSPIPTMPAADEIETYAVVAMSTGHLTEDDRDALQEAANCAEENMVMARPTGFFIKLYDLADSDDLRHGHSESIKRIIQWAKGLGFQGIEFDEAANELPCFPVYEW